MSLQIHNLWKSYSQGEKKIEILKGMNAAIESSQTVSIVGRSGSGKSTLLSLLAGMDRSDQGQIFVNGTDLLKLDETEKTLFRAKNISLVFQQYHLVDHLTSLENVMLPLEILGESDIEKKATACLDELGLSHRLDHFPTQLSGGECQRVAIARALVTRPQILLADEPSGNLDIETGDQVMDYFFKTVSHYKMTTVLVTHSEALAKKCQKTFRLENGQLKEL